MDNEIVIGLPISVSVQATNVTDPVPTLKELTYGCKPLILSTGLEVQSGGWIWEYTSENEYTTRVWSQVDADDGLYEIGDVILKDCNLVKVTGKSGTGIESKQKPLEPEEYAGWDENNSGILDPSTWSHRYFRVANTTNDGWLSKMWQDPTGSRWYYMFWENRGFGGCSSGAYRWSAKDNNANYGERNIGYYLRSCMLKGYSQKFDSSKDLIGTLHNWGSTYCTSGSNKVNCPTTPTIMFNSMVERDSFFYFRTHLNKPIEYGNFTTGSSFSYSYSNVHSPADISGFVEKRQTQAFNPFDGKNYTKAKFTPTDGSARWTVVASEPFDSVAFGNVICDTIDLKIKDKNGNILLELNNYVVENDVNNSSAREYDATVILYTGRNEDGTVNLIDSESVIEIQINGSAISIGEIIAGETLDAGFTKTSFKNTFKDFSKKEQDDWGNWYYDEEGVKLSVHSGTVNFPVLDYDGMNRLMLLIGGRKVLVNSSDSLLNQAPDGRHIFEATQIIGRFTKMDMSTKEVKKRIGEIAEYTFNIEELS